MLVLLQVNCEGADKAGMHIVYPGLRPMFHEHVESRAMQYARLRRTALQTEPLRSPQTAANCVNPPADREAASCGLINGSGTADSPATEVAPFAVQHNGTAVHSVHAKMEQQNVSAPALGPQHALESSQAGVKPRPVNGTTSALESPGRHVELSDVWGSVVERAGIDAASATSAQGGPVTDVHVSVATPDDQKKPPIPELMVNHGQTPHSSNHAMAARNDVNANGKVSDYDQAAAVAEGTVQASPTVRARKRGRDGCTSTGGKAQDGVNMVECTARGAPRGECPATASVLWQPCGSVAQLGGMQGHHLPLRAMHVAMLCQWRTNSAADGGDVDVHWVTPCSSSVVAAARSLHRLAFIHWCHWGFALQAHQTCVAGGAGSATTPPRVAHWPIHCALAARACRLAQQVLT